ncbi:hypothetical protein AAGS40_25030 (plasmid) [Paraburkholderia sp. PREW-6R]|uniref:hypothetical protein n=1 Tax=Paraburkholderia sp. PREW-6R TaxID=3141544 RepID=UPI0031F506F9
MASKIIVAASARPALAGLASLRTKLARAMGLSLCFTTLACAAQTPPVQGPGMPVPPPVAGGPAGGAQTIAPPPPAPQPVRQSASETGTVSRFVINPEGDVDGFLLGDGSLVHFPPHMSAQLVGAIHSGDPVKIVGVRDSGGNMAAQQITNERTQQQVVDQPAPVNTMRMPPALRGAGLVRLSVEGTVARVTTAPRGEPDGVMLSNGTIIKMPPPVAQQFASLMRPDVVVAASGYGTRNQYGEALQATAFGAPGKLTPLYDNTPN